MKSTYSNTTSVQEFKNSNNVSKINFSNTSEGKPYAKTDNGIEMKVSNKVEAEIKLNGLANIRVSTVTNIPETDDEIGSSVVMIHLVKANDVITFSI